MNRPTKQPKKKNSIERNKLQTVQCLPKEEKKTTSKSIAKHIKINNRQCSNNLDFCFFLLTNVKQNCCFRIRREQFSSIYGISPGTTHKSYEWQKMGIMNQSHWSFYHQRIVLLLGIDFPYSPYPIDAMVGDRLQPTHTHSAHAS